MQWIKTDEQLPEFNKQIIFYSDECDSIQMGAFYRNSHTFRSDGNIFYKSDVTHWVSCPARP